MTHIVIDVLTNVIREEHIAAREARRIIGSDMSQLSLISNSSNPLITEMHG